MSLAEPGRLYRLLPALYRLRDAECGEPLRALLALLEGEFDLVEAGIAGQYDDWFIETCSEWVVPYIGDLLGVQPLEPIASAGVSARAIVANALAFRRRKGTARVLEQVVRDASGWPAHAVEFFMRLATTQHVNHVRLHPAATARLRAAAIAQLPDTAFDPHAHTAEVRNAGARGGRYNISRLGLFVWRLRSYRVGAGAPGDPAPDFASARRVGNYWTVHPAGVDCPLFNPPRGAPEEGQPATEDAVPGPLRPLFLNDEFERMRNDSVASGQRAEPALRVWVRLAQTSAPVEVAQQDMYLCALPETVLEAQAPPLALAVDPVRGRLAFPPALAVEQVLVQSCYGFAGDLGGGPYDRNAAVLAANAFAAQGHSLATDRVGFFDPGVWQAGVSHLAAAAGTGQLFGSLRAALAEWNKQPAGSTGVIVLMDSLSDDAGAPAPLEVEIAQGAHLLIVAGEWWPEVQPDGSAPRVPGRFAAERTRAHLVGDLVVRGAAGAGAGDPGACSINGVLLEGRLRVAPGNLGALEVAHSTLLGGDGAVQVGAGNDRLRLALSRSICDGGIALAAPIAGVAISDSIVTAGGAAALDAADTDATLLRSTFLGATQVRVLDASDCIFAAPVRARRRQAGCVRFSYLAPGSAPPRRYRCQPDLELAAQGIDALAPAEAAALRSKIEAQLAPRFTSRRYGQPGFGKLAPLVPAALRAGAESGAEMGAFEFLREPQREANLRRALTEYLPFGLEPTVLFAT